MRISRPHLWIACVSAAAVVWVALVDVSRNSPGPLAAVHGRVEELAGRSCARCHGGLLGTMTESCLECHATIEAQIEDGAGLHGALGEREAARCAACHSEHHGATFALVNELSFAKAGAPDPDAFPHDLVGFPMDGKHLELACTECHANAEVEVLQAGTRRFGGLDQDCAACHEDPHEGRMGFGCAQCHGQTDFHELASRGHAEHLPLVGGHGDLSCRACHAEDGPHALEVLGTRRSPGSRTCAACHESPHDAGFLAGVARLSGTGTDTSCVVCHEAEHRAFREEDLEVSAAQHAASGFPLQPPHQEVSCAACHAPELLFAERFPGREPDGCHACHADPHGGQFAGGAFASGCLACHERQRFEPHGFGAERHAETAFALSGTHLELECNACHLDPPEGAPRAFHGTASECSACHADAHGGFFLRRADDAHWREAADLRREARDCATCHVTTAFADAAAESFDHELWAAFALDGAHGQEACEACHPRAEQPGGDGRSFGRVEDRFGPAAVATACGSCHLDPHEGGFSRQEHPLDVAGREGCARCHGTTSFRSLPHGFDHDYWTGFSLVGRHEEIACNACHPPLGRPDPRGRTWGPATGTSCADCHADHHGGQFSIGGVPKACDACHASSISFADLSFDHDRDSYFRLGEAHAGVACGACHAEEALPEGGRIVRYKPLPKDCASCHGVQEHVLRRKRGR